METYDIEGLYGRIMDENAALRVITSHYIPLNVWLIRYLGLDAALFLSAVYEELLYLKEKGKAKLYDSQVRFSTRKAKLKTGLGETRQRKALEVLESHHLLSTYKEGWIPTYRNIVINFQQFPDFETKLNEFISKETEKSKKTKEEFEQKMKDIHEEVVNKKIGK